MRGGSFAERVALIERRLTDLDEVSKELPSTTRARVMLILSEIERLASAHEADRVELDRVVSRVEIFREAAFQSVKESASGSMEPTLSRLLNLVSAESEVLRLLSTKLLQAQGKHPLRCLGVVSTAPGEGKTTVAVGLARALARERNRRVLLIEADLHAPTVERVLGLSRRSGLGDWLQDPHLPLPLRQIDVHSLDFLSAGTPGEHPAELLRSDAMARLMDVARRTYDFVVVDCPPPFPFADTIILQNLLDGLLLVVRARHTSREEVRGVLNHLRADMVRGVVFNDYSEVLPRWYSRGRSRYYYYGSDDNATDGGGR